MHSATNSGILGASLAEEINDSDLLKTALQGIQPTIQMNLRLKWMVNLQIRKKCRMSSLPQLMFQYVFLPSFNVAGSDIINDPMSVLLITVPNNQVNSMSHFPILPTLLILQQVLLQVRLPRRPSLLRLSRPRIPLVKRDTQI